MESKKNEPPKEVLPVLKQTLSDYADAEDRYWENVAIDAEPISDELLAKLLAIPGGELIEIDITGTPLSPGHPATCEGNGEHEGYPLCCDECDYLKACYESNEWGKEDDEMEEKKIVLQKISECEEIMSVLYEQVAAGLNYVELCLIEDALAAFTPEYTSGNELAEQRLTDLKKKITATRGWVHLHGKTDGQ